MNDIKILAVDDEPALLEMVKRILSLGKYSVDTASGGEEAVIKIKQKKNNFRG